ncbi:hypothetical protein FACS1894109_08770 [Spirochaetia bacterium]|nr:hypothetical protein FACS1894109_08770 [Spirochaetia bacterium]
MMPAATKWERLLCPYTFTFDEADKDIYLFHNDTDFEQIEKGSKLKVYKYKL